MFGITQIISNWLWVTWHTMFNYNQNGQNFNTYVHLDWWMVISWHLLLQNSKKHFNNPLRIAPQQRPKEGDQGKMWFLMLWILVCCIIVFNILMNNMHQTFLLCKVPNKRFKINNFIMDLQITIILVQCSYGKDLIYLWYFYLAMILIT